MTERYVTVRPVVLRPFSVHCILSLSARHHPLHGDETMITARIGTKVRYYDSLRTAVIDHNMKRDASGKGYRRWTLWVLDHEGETLSISYNGRVWRGLPQDWSPETQECEVDLTGTPWERSAVVSA
jgi:hypothetical protein